MKDYIYSTPHGHSDMIHHRLKNMRNVECVVFLTDDSLYIRSQQPLPSVIVVDDYYLQSNPHQMLTSEIKLTDQIDVLGYTLTFKVQLKSMNDEFHEIDDNVTDNIMNLFYNNSGITDYLPNDTTCENISYSYDDQYYLNVYIKFNSAIIIPTIIDIGHVSTITTELIDDDGDGEDCTVTCTLIEIESHQDPIQIH